MYFFKKNVGGSLIRLCRIQISSKLRNQNLYPDHFFELECSVNNIYSLDNPAQLKKHKLTLFANMNNPLYFINSNVFFIKINDDPNNYYIDIAILVEDYNDNVHVNINTVNENAVNFFGDIANINEYTRLKYNVTPNAILALSNSYIYLSTALNIRILKQITKITEMSSNTVAWIIEDNLLNADNDKFTVTKTDSDNYSTSITITPKQNSNIYIENFIK